MRDARDEGFENANVGVNVCRRDGSQRRQIVQDGCGLGYISFVKLHLQLCYRMCVGVGVAGREGLGESRDPGEAGGGRGRASAESGERAVECLAPVLPGYQYG